MIKDAKKIGVWGGTGSGKSTRTKELIKGNHRLIVFDPIGDYGQEKTIKNCTSLLELYKNLKQKWDAGFRLSYSVPRGENPRLVLEQLSQDIFAIQDEYFKGNDSRQITLVVEEMSVSFPERTLPDNERGFQELINLGRHYGVNIIGVSQRMANVKKDFVSNCAAHYFFRMGAHIDYTAMQQIIGKDNTDKAKAMPNYNYLCFENGEVKTGKTRKI